MCGTCRSPCVTLVVSYWRRGRWAPGVGKVGGLLGSNNLAPVKHIDRRLLCDSLLRTFLLQQRVAVGVVQFDGGAVMSPWLYPAGYFIEADPHGPRKQPCKLVNPLVCINLQAMRGPIPTQTALC